MSVLLGVDTGGTFTDFVLWQNGRLITHKVLSTPHAPEQAVLQGINELGLDKTSTLEFHVVHGSTVATNAVLEGKGVPCVYISNHGLRDVLTLGRQARRELYNLQPRPRQPPVPRDRCLETGGRLSATGEVLEDLDEAMLAELIRQVAAIAPRAVAINLLYSWLDDDFEKRIEAALKTLPEPPFISRSSAVLPEYREYERGITTWLNAYVGPLVAGYLQRLAEGVPHAGISVMQSSGGTIAAEQAGARAVNMLLSGPAGGLAAARYLGELTDTPRLLTFDMGGTSTDVAMIDGELQLTSEGEIAGYPVAVPMVDMHTIGAGGGSIARVDAGGLLQVGPESAGANPGPACYGQGGQLPTVTDANLILGRLRAEAFLGGGMTLDIDAARRAMTPVAESLSLSLEAAAEGVLRIANEHMAQALRVISVQRGIDPRALTLVSFGGAGGLHVCALAEALQIRQALVPIHAGVLSALGMLVAPRSRQLSRTHTGLLEDMATTEIEAGLKELQASGIQALQAEGVAASAMETRFSLDLRYQGQSYTLNIDWDEPLATAKRFHRHHQRRFGHRLDLPVELVNLRVGLKSQGQSLHLHRLGQGQPVEARQQVGLPGIEGSVAVYQRESLAEGQLVEGPALITETVSTTFIAPGWACQVDEVGNLCLEKS